MSKQEVLVIGIETVPVPELTLEEVCESYHVSADWLKELIAYGVIEPHHARFDMYSLSRIRRFIRLQEDLEVNLAGAALALDLLEQIDTLQKQVDLFKKHVQIKF